MGNKREQKKESFKLAQISSVGITLLLCILIGWWIGDRLDKWLHTDPLFTIIFLVIGIGAGFKNVISSIDKYTS